jgi:hypothetical protein
MRSCPTLPTDENLPRAAARQAQHRGLGPHSPRGELGGQPPARGPLVASPLQNLSCRFAAVAMRLFHEVIHSFLSFAVIPLCLAGSWGLLQLLHWLVPSTNSREFALWLGLTAPGLLTVGAIILGPFILAFLVYKVGKRSSARSRRNL